LAKRKTLNSLQTYTKLKLRNWKTIKKNSK